LIPTKNFFVGIIFFNPAETALGKDFKQISFFILKAGLVDFLKTATAKHFRQLFLEYRRDNGFGENTSIVE
jgi:hypothetical protein